jgi:hypothetical protein
VANLPTAGSSLPRLGRETLLRSAKLGLAVVGVLTTTGASLDLGGAVVRFGGSAALAFEGTGQNLGAKASFSSGLYRGPYNLISTVVIPLVSAQYKATPDYEYLYTASSAYSTMPTVPSYRYAADNSYLLRPSSSYHSAASAYRWRNCTSFRPDAEQHASLERPRTGRDGGQKAAGGLKPSAIMQGDQQRLWQPSPALRDVRLAEGFRRSQSGSIPARGGSQHDCL